ncbi:unnamed protein product [Moneuplotes crassus]|uniref:Uncharacterized protein n=1 Tax=Euplotes crassus TaxID=5936 RepID=A0AAD1U3K0_EUPCR|nr:unnamed protein product [Moneuplotes crassus]
MGLDGRLVGEGEEGNMRDLGKWRIDCRMSEEEKRQSGAGEDDERDSRRNEIEKVVFCSEKREIKKADRKSKKRSVFGEGSQCLKSQKNDIPTLKFLGINKLGFSKTIKAKLSKICNNVSNQNCQKGTTESTKSSINYSRASTKIQPLYQRKYVIRDKQKDYIFQNSNCQNTLCADQSPSIFDRTFVIKSKKNTLIGIRGRRVSQGYQASANPRDKHNITRIRRNKSRECILKTKIQPRPSLPTSKPISKPIALPVSSQSRPPKKPLQTLLRSKTPSSSYKLNPKILPNKFMTTLSQERRLLAHSVCY